MNIRGHRQCTQCENEWSYFETEDIECPQCGSLRSRAIDRPTIHTASKASISLEMYRKTVDGVPTPAQQRQIRSACNEYLRNYGFISEGSLLPLEVTYVSVMELKYLTHELSNLSSPTQEIIDYWFSLLKADLGARPSPDDVPRTCWAPRGLAVARVVSEYRRAIQRLSYGSNPSMFSETLERLGDHTRRVEALDGELSPSDTEQLVVIIRALGQYRISDSESALSEAVTRLDQLDQSHIR